MNDKTMLIVGGSGGIGAAVALGAAKAGWNLTLHGRDAERLARTAGACDSAREAALEAARGAARVASMKTRVFAADLTPGDLPDGLIAEASRCDALVLAHGPFVMKSLEETDPADWERMAWSNLALPGILACAAARTMAARGFGRILFFGGTRTDTVRGFKKNAAYAASKTGLGVLAKSLAAEYAGRGVSSAVICPGLVRTEYQDDEFRARMDALSPRGRQTDAASLAGVALWLLSGGMDTCNGAIINADEGLYAL